MKTQLQTILVLHIFGETVCYKQILFPTTFTMYSFDASVQYFFTEYTKSNYQKFQISAKPQIEEKYIIKGG